MSDDLAIGEVSAHRVPLPPAGSNRVVRIFISSPGDVAEEREQARRVIEGLQRQYPGASLRPVLWEDLALPATATFQQGIEAAEQDKSWFAAAFHLRKLLERSPDDAELRARHERALANAREADAIPPDSPPAASKAPER